MPRFFFDTDDGTGLTADDHGQELADVERLRFLALDVLPDLAREIIPAADDRILGVYVRDEQGEYVFEASLSLKTRWLKLPQMD